MHSYVSKGAAPPIPARVLFKAKATWNYNEDKKVRVIPR